MTRNKRKVESALQSKGFDKVEGDHHYFVYSTKGGLRSHVFTKTSHSERDKDIDDGRLAQMAKQCKLKKPEFLTFVDCDMNRDEYEGKLIQQGVIKFDDGAGPRAAQR